MWNQLAIVLEMDGMCCRVTGSGIGPVLIPNCLESSVDWFALLVLLVQMLVWIRRGGVADWLLLCTC